MARWPVLKVENYGPVKRAELELRPLTVLVGKNNTGKSYLASLIYTIGDALSGPQVLLLSMFPRSDKVKIIKNIIKDRVVPYVEKAVRWRAEKLMIILQASINLSITISRQDHVNVEVEIGKEFEDYLEEHLKELERRLEEEEELWGFSVWRPGTVLNSPIYLLAERAGILRVYRPILATYVRTTIFEFLPKNLKSLIERPEPSVRLPKFAADFLTEILLSPPLEEEYFSEELKLLEKIMEGRIEVMEELEIAYLRGSHRVVLDRASSLVAELAPLYLALKRLAPGRSIIIEEPEAHVHPRAQVMLCRLFARLVRKGVPVLMTTHSSLMPVALAHLVGLSGLRPEQREELGYGRDEYLRQDELAIYWLRWDGDGSVAEEVKVEPTGALERIPEMDEVIEDLYGEEARLLELSALASKSA